jgi:metallo-beta-lactamase family protein
MSLQLQFLGAAGTVTGSKYLLRNENICLLIDCGLYQGVKNNRLRNWEKLPVALHEIDAIILTHAHLDHSGFLPVLIRDGFRGKVYSTQGTYDLCGLLLPDSGHLQEEDAEFANRHGFSKHHPALPLYTQEEAEKALNSFQPEPYKKTFTIKNKCDVTFIPAGHIIGASSVIITIDGKKIAFSGDIGRSDDLFMRAPQTVPAADYVVIESTYGNRLHPKSDPKKEIAEIVEMTMRRQGTILIPAFAVGRSQLLLHLFTQLMIEERIPNLPMYLDSPMAVHATRIYEMHSQDHKLSHADFNNLNQHTKYVENAEDSMSLIRIKSPKIIVSASGMATGGRVLHHLKNIAPDDRNTLLFAGFQAVGTRGANIIGGIDRIKIHGEYVPIRAHIAHLDYLSAHADRNGLIDWLRAIEHAPQRVFVTHGEPDSADALRLAIQDELGWNAHVPSYLDVVTL